MKDVTATLREIRQGQMLDELGDAITNAVTACRETGKAARVTLTLDVRPVSKGQGNALTVADDVKVKLPRVDKAAAVFYADDAGQLSRTDPRQPKLPELRDVSVAQFPPLAASRGNETPAEAGGKG